jgi:hypothetical protein
VNLPSHPQVSLLSSHLKFSTYPGACVHQTKWTPIHNEDLDQPVAERGTRRSNRQLPKRYQDIAPEPLVPLLPLPSQPERPEADSAISTRRILKSLRNAFGLYRQYYAICFLDRDPIENITPNDLTDLQYTIVGRSRASRQD